VIVKRSQINQHGRLRIIGGQWKKRLIRFRGAADLRPTPDSVRETLFNWLAPVVVDAQCLDLFAGSGALGIEAASRGAASVNLVEIHRVTCRQLSDTLSMLNASNVSVHCEEVLDWLDHCNTRYDIVFVDPPYGEGLVDRCLNRLERCAVLNANAQIYVECGAREKLVIPSGWRQLQHKTAGQVAYRLFSVSETRETLGRKSQSGNLLRI